MENKGKTNSTCRARTFQIPIQVNVAMQHLKFLKNGLNTNYIKYIL